MLMPRPSPLTRISRDAAGIVAYEDLPKVILTLRQGEEPLVQTESSFYE